MSVPVVHMLAIKGANNLGLVLNVLGQPGAAGRTLHGTPHPSASRVGEVEKVPNMGGCNVDEVPQSSSPQARPTTLP